MYNFYVTEIRQLPNGEYEHETHYTYDEDLHTAQLKGESKYHDVMSKAAISVANGATVKHSAILFNTNAFPMLHGSYEAATVPEAE